MIRNSKNNKDKNIRPGSNPLDYPANTKKWSVLIAIGIGTLMSALDGSIVNTVLPVLHDYFSTSVAAIEWVITIYLLVLCGVLLSFGRIGDIQGHKKMYLLGFGIFIVASALCGMSNSVTSLIIFRAIQAVGAAMLQANSPAIITSSFPARQRGQALGLVATMTYLGLTIGPSLGGWLADHLSWRAVFYVNVPIGIAAFLLSARAIQSDAPTTKRETFDVTGASLFLAGLMLLIFALNEIGTQGFVTPPIIAYIAVSFVLLGIFIWVERRTVNPMLDLRLFSSAQFSSSIASAVINYIGVYSITFLLPFFMINGLQLSPSRAGLILTSMPVIMAIMAPISGALSDKQGTRGLAAIGMATLAGGLFFLSRANYLTSEIGVVLRLIIIGFGIGVFISPNTSALMGAAPKERQGIASGVLATSRNLGMVLGVGLSGAVFTSHLGHGEALIPTEVITAVQISLFTTAVITAIGIPIILLPRRRYDGQRS